MAEPVWDVPEVSSEDFRYEVGTSLLTEFAVGHSPSDVLRELVQNEYDAGGTSLDVVFGADGLTIRGNGATIDRGGWKRLTVMLGTGVVAGASTEIRPKVNGIGSKNFGLRSLFLFGDRLHVASGGHQTILDRRLGALPQPIPHRESRARRGVMLHVPYRRADDGRLYAFDERHEHDALAGIAFELAPTLVKLALPNSTKSVRSVRVRSERLGHELLWRQSVRELDRPSRPLGRSVRITQRGIAIPKVPGSFTETEYRRFSRPPEGLRGRSFPAYFRSTGGRIRIGISFQTKGQRLRPEAVGIFYYPIGASRSRTGFPFSISAPFEMTEDRSQIVDLANSDWNTWLIDEAAAFVVELLRSELFDTFGADAYLALDPSAAQATTVPRLPTVVKDRLESQPCWPTRSRSRRKKLIFAPVTALTVATPALADLVDALLDDNHLLHPALADRTDTTALAGRLGAKTFTVNSLIRLRCAGADASDLETKLKPAEAARYYTGFPESLEALEVQVLLARALEVVRGKLSPHHKSDLRTAATTLTAAGGLDSPDKPLWVLEEAMTGVVSSDATLHSALAEFRVISGLCKRFQASRWAVETAERVSQGKANDHERGALHRYLLGRPTLSRRAWTAVRNSPVLLDHRGEWVAAEDLVQRTAPCAQYAEPVLRFLPTADEKDELVERLGVRATLRGGDLVLLAEQIADGAIPPGPMVDLLTHLPKLLTSAVIKRLRDIPFLETTAGTIVAPASAYERNNRTVVALGDATAWAVPLPGKLLRRLGCRVQPAVDDIVDRLLHLADASEPLLDADGVYRALHDAGHAERRNLGEFRDKPILFTGTTWVAPEECLVGTDNRSVFAQAVPVLTGPLRDVYIALGAHTKPTAAHWRTLFAWIEAEYGGGRVSPRVQTILTRAYIRLDTVPEGVVGSWRFLLDDQGRLHSVDEASRGAFLINDEPKLADALTAVAAPMTFADTSDARVLLFLRSAGVKPLSKVARQDRVTVGATIEPAPSLRLPDVQARLSHPLFASALAALSATICGADNRRTATRLSTRLRQIESIELVTEIQRHYTIGQSTAVINTEQDTKVDRIIVAKAGTQHDLRAAVARAIATIADPTARGEQLLADPVYFLLRCRTPEEMQRELERRKVPWKPNLKNLWSDDELDRSTDIDPDAEDEVTSFATVVGRAVMQDTLGSTVTPSSSESATSAAVTGGGVLQNRMPRDPLPDLANVSLRTAPAMVTTLTSKPGGGHGASAAWAPRTSEETEEDRELGRHGEELVLKRERKRVASLGFDPSRVVWTANTNPTADHDIRSVDDNGEELWIEVKATSGRTGQFSWPRAEFRLAVHARHHYVLCRIYEADTLTPTAVDLRDPVGMFQAGRLRLNLDSLAADAGPLPPHDPASKTD